MTDRNSRPPDPKQVAPSNGSPTGGGSGALMDSTPAEWFEAELASPQDAAAISRHRNAPSLAPIRRKVDRATLGLAAIVALIVTTLSWIAAELVGVFGSPWWAVPAGLLTALIIRMAAGPDGPDARATVASIVYLVSFIMVMVILTRREIHNIYGQADDVALLEQNLFRRRFAGVDQLAAYAIGWAVSWFASIGLRN